MKREVGVLGRQTIKKRILPSRENPHLLVGILKTFTAAPLNALLLSFQAYHKDHLR